jgi:hypothetical protein
VSVCRAAESGSELFVSKLTIIDIIDTIASNCA